MFPSKNLLASRDGASPTFSSSPPIPGFQTRHKSIHQSFQTSAAETLRVPSPDVIRLIPSTPPRDVGEVCSVMDEDDRILEPARKSKRLRSKPTVRYSVHGIYLPTPESTPPVTGPDDLQDRQSPESPSVAPRSHSSTPLSIDNRSSRHAVTNASTQAARLSNMSSFLTHLEHANSISKTTSFAAPLAYSHSGSFITSFASLRDSLLHIPSPGNRQAQETAQKKRNDAQRQQDMLFSFMEASLGMTPCTTPFTQARNTTEISFKPPMVSTVQPHEVYDRQSLAGIFGPGIYIAPDESAQLEAMVSGPGGERFVFGGAGARSGHIRGSSVLVGVWYRVLDGALKITVAADGAGGVGVGGQEEEVILVDRDVSTAVVMLGRVHEVAAYDLSVGGSGALVTGAVLFVTGLVPMTRFYSRRELADVIPVFGARGSM